jgi:hypothetical protein
MSCDWFEKYDLGKIREETFRSHLEACADCRENVRRDEELFSQARFLKSRVEAPYLWTRIEHSLREEQQKSRFRGYVRILRWPKVFVPLSAVLLFVLCAGLFFWLRPGLKESGLLTDSAVRRVERRERRYERSIQRLERDVIPQMAGLSLDLTLLYRDKLETIDEQITSCKEALAENPGNAHIRRYMLAAFQDKRETLREILKAKNQYFQKENLQ